MQPLLFLIAFGFGIGAMYEKSGNGDYMQFLIPGIVGMNILMSSTMNGMSLIWDKQFGFLKETLVAPVSRISLLFGRCLGGATTSVFQGFIVIVFGYLMGFRITNWAYFPFAILFMFLTALLFNLVGTSLASKFDDMQSFPTIMNFLVMPMVFISGALFPSSNFPLVLQYVVRFNPFTYCIGLLKYFFGISVDINVPFYVGVLLGMIVIVGITGTYLFNKMDT